MAGYEEGSRLSNGWIAFTESEVKFWYQSTLNLSQHANYERALTAHLKRVASPGVDIIVKGRPQALGGDLGAAEINGSPIMFHAMIAKAYIEALLAAESGGVDAFIVASFAEPILPELRSLARIPVVSMTEANFAAAATSAPKIGLVTLNELTVPFLERSIALHKWKERISGIHLVAGSTSEAELNANFSDPGPYLDRLLVGIREAIRGGAQAIILAEGMIGAMAVENGLRDVDGVPVVDPIGTPILFAEMSVALKQRTGLSASPLAYRPPSEAARRLLQGL